METTLSAGHRSLLRDLVARQFGSAAEAAEEICRLVRTAFAADLVCVTRLDGDGDGDGVEILAVEDTLNTGLRPGARVPRGRTVSGRAPDGAVPQSVSDLDSGPYAQLAWPRAVGVQSCAMSPLLDSAGRPTGTLSVLDRRARTFGADEMAVLELLAGLLSREQHLDEVRMAEGARSAELEASDGRYRSVVDDLGDIVVEVGTTGQIAYVNAAWSKLSGLSIEEMVGRDMMEQVHPEDRMLAVEHMAEVLSGGADTVRPDAAREVRFLAADGSIRWMSVRGRAVFGANGDLAGFLGILHDVTERVLAEQQVRDALAEAEAARDEAERASRAKSEFLSRMSHELRTPLNAILGFSQLLELELDGEAAENVEHISRAGRHLLDLINEVLDVVRIEAGVLSLSLEPVEVGEVVSESLDLVRPAANGRGIVLRAPDRLNGARVVADRQRLKQILVNLLSNAVKYNRDDGEVIVTCAPVEGPATDGADHGWLRLTVRDTGQGIPADRLEDVFTPFERLGAEGSGIEGTGVGLSLTKTLVEALGGRLGVASTEGEGSTFWVDLPADAARATELPAAEPAGGAELTRTVLYVEDNPSNITLVRRVLARRPHVRLAVVQDGAEAVEAVQRLVPDLMLLDLHLPGMHGAEILAALRASDDDRLRKMPIVVVTADVSVGNERRMLEAGATLFLPKPIDVHQLLAVVDDHLPQS